MGGRNLLGSSHRKLSFDVDFTNTLPNPGPTLNIYLVVFRAQRQSSVKFIIQYTHTRGCAVCHPEIAAAMFVRLLPRSALAFLWRNHWIRKRLLTGLISRFTLENRVLDSFIFTIEQESKIKSPIAAFQVKVLSKFTE